MASLDIRHGVTVRFCYRVSRTERGKKPGRVLPRPFARGRITPLALNIKMRASEPEG